MVSLAAIIAASASTATAFLAPANINIHTIRRSTITTTTTTMPTFHRKIHIVWADKPPDDGGGKGGGGNSNSNGNGNGNGTGNGLDDFLDPKKAFQESDNLKRARAALSEDALPITFKEEGSGTGTGTVSGLDAQDDDGQSQDINDEGSTINSNSNNSNSNNITEEEEKENKEKAEEENANVSADSDTDTDSSGSTALTSTSSDLVVAMNEKNNAYLNVVAKLSPSDLISKFTTTAHPRVQDAVRSTILGLIGTLPQMAFETTTITTGERLASLMFQLQMTGYMFKNAEYRLSLSQSLGMSSTSTSTNMMLLLEGDGDDDDGVQLDDDDDDEDGPLSSGQVRGKIKVRYGVKRDDETASSSSSSDAANDDESKGSDEDEKDEKENSSPGMEVEVDAAAYMAELRNEVAKLRDDLSATRKSKEEAIRKDLLLYIRTLPQQELNTLTDTMSNDVMGAMKGLVNVVMGGIGEGQIDKDTVTEQSGEAMAQLCMWQLVVGYNLRELEVREEMKNALVSGSLDNDNGNGSNGESGVEDDDGNDDTDDGKGSIDYGSGGFE